MAWISPLYRARFDFLTALDATALHSSQQLLRRLVEPAGLLHRWEVSSARRLARGQVRLEVEFRLLGDNRLVINHHDLRELLEELVGSAHYLHLQPAVLPVVRLYRTRLLM